MSLKLVDEWRELNLSALDATMGQKWMQKELRRRFGINGGYVNLDLRTSTSNRSHPHVRADFLHLPFPDSAFAVILFDPPFLVDRRSASGHDYRTRQMSHYTRPQGFHRDFAGGYAWKGGGSKFGVWFSREQLRETPLPGIHRTKTGTGAEWSYHFQVDE